MDASIFLARFLGIYCIVIAVAMFFHKDKMKAILDEFFKSPTWQFVGGVMALIFGLLIVLSNPVVKPNWQGLITLVGLLALAKGILVLFFPRYSHALTKAMVGPRVFLVLMLVVAIIGLILLYFGFAR